MRAVRLSDGSTVVVGDETLRGVASGNAVAWLRAVVAATRRGQPEPSQTVSDRGTGHGCEGQG